MNSTELILKLFSPDKDGYSRWVKKNELVGEYASLYPTNGNHWYRNKGLSKYIFEKSKDDNGNDMWRFNGFKTDEIITRSIKKEIRSSLINESCAHTGQRSNINNPIQIDHKNGRYNGIEVIDIENQKLENFQPLNRQSNLQKRSNCNTCKKTNKRFDAKTLGFGKSFTVGDENYDETLGCVGCYWYDCMEFKKKLTND